jgi:tetratricopeptide (TPR) repeat protein
LLGQPDHALPILEEAVRPEKASFSAVPSSYPLTALAEVYRLKGDTKKAVHNAEEALSIFRQREERGFAAWALYYMAKIQSEDKSEQIQHAIQTYRQAMEQAVGLGMRPLAAHSHLGLGQLYLRKGEPKEARSELLAAMDLYRTMSMSYWLTQSESSLEEISS